MGVIDKFKRDITKHRGRAAILGVLFVTMIVMGIRAAVELRGTEAATTTSTPATASQADATTSFPTDSIDAQTRIQHSKDLWQALKKVRPDAIQPEAAFTFDGAFYPAPPVIAEPIKTPGPEIVIKPEPAPVIVDDTPIRTARIREEARALVIKTISLGGPSSQPMAIINQQLVTTGQKILGFEIVAIRSREVEFVKDGVTVVGKMSDGQ